MEILSQVTLPMPRARKRFLAVTLFYMAVAGAFLHGQDNVEGDGFGGTDLGSGWLFSEWFGYYSVSFHPWIFHNEHGWQYVSEGENDGELYLYDLRSEDWWFTSESFYPSFFSFGRRTWNSYFLETVNPRQFVDLESGDFWWDSVDLWAFWNDLEPEPWWRESAPYSCLQEEKQTSPWLRAGLIDLGGSDPLSLIRYFGNGSYLRYAPMGFLGCTPMQKYPDSFHQDSPADPTYYSLGDLDIWVDIARVPTDASGWFMDDRIRVDISMEQAVALLNQYIAPYFRRISQDNLRITFHEGNEFKVEGDGGPLDAETQQYKLVGACLDGCEHGDPGGLNRILLNDVASDTEGQAFNGWAGNLASRVSRLPTWIRSSTRWAMGGWRGRTPIRRCRGGLNPMTKSARPIPIPTCTTSCRPWPCHRYQAGTTRCRRHWRSIATPPAGSNLKT